MQTGFDINKLSQEAQNRWLKPSEVLFVLQNHERCPLTLEPLKKPPSGSLFLLNRRILRFFRKDGHAWRKKKDGRSVGEAHERLKVGNVDALNCYYAHGEQNPYFQRRSYWMLDPAYEHIVLVHYREVSEGGHLAGSISNLSTGSSSTFSQSTGFNNTVIQGFTSGSSELYEPNHSSCSPGSVEEVSSKFVVENNMLDHLNTMDRSRNYDCSSQPEFNQALRKLTEQLSLGDDDNSIYFEEKLPPYCSQNDQSQDSGLLDYETRDSTQEPLENLLHGLTYEERGQYFVEDAGSQYGSTNIHLLESSGGKGKQQSPSGSAYSVERKDSPSWKEMLELSSSSTGINARRRTSDSLAVEGVLESSTCTTHAVQTEFPARDTILHENDVMLSSSGREKISVNPYEQSEKLTWQQLDYRGTNPENRPNSYQISGSDLHLQLSATRRFLLGSDTPIDSPTSISHLLEVEKPICYTSETSTSEANSDMVMLRKENSSDWMGTMHLAVDNSTYSSECSGLWFEPNQFEAPLGTDSSLTVAQKQRFSIREISPEWAFSSETTKVIITGDFLCSPSECLLAAMFGDVEVPLEIVQEGVLRCQAPQHGSGKVTLCITSGNRESCSEIRDFEYRAKPNTYSSISNLPQADATKSTEELVLLVRFVQMLLCGCDNAPIPKEGDVVPEIEPSRELKRTDDQWGQIIKTLLAGSGIPLGTMDWLMQELLKDKLQQWLLSKYQDTGYSLSRQEQGVIHWISGLGYEWALKPLLDSGVGINFRDLNGWTSLHWAARFGREKMVAALLAAGASAGAVTDPTSQDPTGKTPASISAAHGHKGLAGYLSEVSLTSHLSSLTMKESEISKGCAAVEAERAVESISQRSAQIHVGVTEDQLSLKDSLAAVRNSAQAAARIQSAFRAHSFRKRQQNVAESPDEYGMTPEDIHGLSSATKFHRAFHAPRDQKFDKAALSIQKKYRGWKGRKDFLALRQNVVKIQAHVRGHQVRKKYKEVLWTVGVVEKVILRWRRGGVGLRGFRAEPEPIDESEEDDILKIFRKQKVDAALDEAVSRVLSMVESPEARQQYRRMLESYREAKAELSNASETTSRFQGDCEIIEDDDDMF